MTQVVDRKMDPSSSLVYYYSYIWQRPLLLTSRAYYRTIVTLHARCTTACQDGCRIVRSSTLLGYYIGVTLFINALGGTRYDN